LLTMWNRSCSRGSASEGPAWAGPDF